VAVVWNERAGRLLGLTNACHIHRYPAELIDMVHLADGTRVLIRPVLPEDQELMAAFFHDLSPDARCNRFLHPLREPSSELLRQFTHVDYAKHVALVAETFVDDRENMIGEARYVQVPEPASAEVSVSVADPWQGNGLAKIMLTKLECCAAAAGIRRLIAETLATNEKFLSLARHAGFSESCAVRGVIRLEKILIADPVVSQV
jgi:RimJ/RimL family protein N-acetyltransferase